MLSSEEIKYYDRQILLPEFNISGQEKLKAAKVLIIGAGGLGCPAATYLAAAGIGSLAIADNDSIEISNLHRQTLYRYTDIGKKKADVAIERLGEKNPFIELKSFPVRITRDNAFNLLMSYDIIVDGSDNFATRYLLNDICVKMDKVFISGSVFQFTGSVAVFNARLEGERRSATYRCLFPQPPASEDAADCNTIGIVGIIPGMIGNMMAAETIKLLTGIGTPLINNYLVLDVKTMQTNIFTFSRNEEEAEHIRKSPLEDEAYYEAFCSSKSSSALVTKEVLAPELKQMVKEKEDFLLIDVREPYEHELINIGGYSLPVSELQTRFFEIPRDKKVVLYCKMGSRSLEALKYLQLHKGYTNLFHLKGGIREYMQNQS